MDDLPRLLNLLNTRLTSEKALTKVHLQNRTQYENLLRIFRSEEYIKYRTRLITIVYLREVHQVTLRYYKELTELCDGLFKFPCVNPVISREERDRILDYLKYLQNHRDTESTEDDAISDSVEDDIPKHLRRYPLCVRCKSPSMWLCGTCGKVSYCSSWCELMSAHRCTKTKEKSD